MRPPPRPTLFPYTTLFRSGVALEIENSEPAPFSIACATFDRRRNPARGRAGGANGKVGRVWLDRKSTRLNSSHMSSAYAVFCLKKKIIRFRHRVDKCAGEV